MMMQQSSFIIPLTQPSPHGGEGSLQCAYITPSPLGGEGWGEGDKAEMFWLITDTPSPETHARFDLSLKGEVG